MSQGWHWLRLTCRSHGDPIIDGHTHSRPAPEEHQAWEFPTFVGIESKTECLIWGNITLDLMIFFLMENKTMRNRAVEASHFSM